MNDADRLSLRRVNLTIYQGETYKHTFRYRDEFNQVINLEGWSARLQVRSSPSSELILYTAAGHMTVDGIRGEVKLVIPATVTAGWTWRSGVYDSEIFFDTEVEKFVYGSVRVKPEITR